MNKWLARAKTCFSDEGQGCTDRTDETPLLSVLAAPPEAIYKLPDRLSSVSSVGVWAVLEKTQLAQDLINAAMKQCDEFNDSEAAREQMRRDCLELSPELQADLHEHFIGKPVGGSDHLDEGLPDTVR